MRAKEGITSLRDSMCEFVVLEQHTYPCAPVPCACPRSSCTPGINKEPPVMLDGLYDVRMAGDEHVDIHLYQSGQTARRVQQRHEPGAQRLPMRPDHQLAQTDVRVLRQLCKKRRALTSCPTQVG